MSADDAGPSLLTAQQQQGPRNIDVVAPIVTLLDDQSALEQQLLLLVIPKSTEGVGQIVERGCRILSEFELDIQTGKIYLTGENFVTADSPTKVVDFKAAGPSLTPRSRALGLAHV